MHRLGFIDAHWKNMNVSAAMQQMRDEYFFATVKSSAGFSQRGGSLGKFAHRWRKDEDRADAERRKDEYRDEVRWMKDEDRADARRRKDEDRDGAWW